MNKGNIDMKGHSIEQLSDIMMTGKITSQHRTDPNDSSDVLTTKGYVDNFSPAIKCHWYGWKALDGDGGCSDDTLWFCNGSYITETKFGDC